MAEVGRNWQLDEPSRFSKSRDNHGEGNDLEVAGSAAQTKWPEFAWQLDEPSSFQNPATTTTMGMAWKLLKLKTRTFAGVSKNWQLDEPSRF